MFINNPLNKLDGIIWLNMFVFRMCQAFANKVFLDGAVELFKECHVQSHHYYVILIISGVAVYNDIYNLFIVDKQ